MFFLTPRHIKEGRHYRHALRRLMNYKRDVLPAKELEILQSLDADMTAAIKSRKRQAIAEVKERIEKEVGRITPPLPDAGWRENVEVIVVAIVIAAGVRAYFLQPFKIPTGSMQPTLYGIIGVRTEAEPPNIVQRAVEFAWLGRSYFNLTAKEDDVVASVTEKTYLNFFTFTTIQGQKDSYQVFMPLVQLRDYFRITKGSILKKGEPIARGYVDTGDQVFVDKMSYNFISPARGDVFVFKTNGIRGIEASFPPGVESQHYIKRLAGIPGDKLRIAAPKLFINGSVPTNWVFQRVMSEQNGYRGYSNLASLYLSDPSDEFPLPDNAYFALGDNSYHSSDSRFWGSVPEKNVAGRGLFVYWPFSKRWGLIR